MRVYIPSRGRASRIGAAAHTVKQLHGKRDVCLVVPLEEEAEYKKAVEDRSLNCEVLPAKVYGISDARLWCALHAERTGEAITMMMDDDIRFYRRKPGVVNLKNCESLEDIEEMFYMIEAAFRDEDFAAVGISAREGNNRVETPFAQNTRLMRAWSVRTEEYLECEHNRVPVMEDFDTLLQLLRKGRPNACLYEFAQGQGQTQAPGGCSSWRTHEVHENAAIKLAEMHDPFVRLRQKENKTGGEFGTRTEVSIQWKKAYASSQG